MLVFLYACTPSANEVKFGVMPEGLKDCKTFEVWPGDGNKITVFRCPNSTTSINYMQGKVHKTVITIDGIEYIPKEK